MQSQFFPSKTLAIYVGRAFLVRSISVLAALVLILQTLDLLGESGNVLAYPGNGQAELWTYVSLRAPQIVARFLPFSVLLGTIITLATLNQNSEVISMKAAGLSAHQVLAPLIVASLFIAGFSFVFNDRVVTRATATLARWEKADFGPIKGDSKSVDNVWVREGPNIISAKMVTGRGPAAKLSGVTIYNRQSGELDSIVRGSVGIQKDGSWEIPDARKFIVATGTETDMGRILIGRGIRPDQFTLSNVVADRMSFGELKSAIANLKDAGRPTQALEGGLWHKISGPLSSVLMPLLGAVAAFGIARSGRLFIRAVIGMGLGFAYFVGDNFGLAMGNLGAYPPLLAAWGPFFLFLLIGETVLIRTEE